MYLTVLAINISSKMPLCMLRGTQIATLALQCALFCIILSCAPISQLSCFALQATQMLLPSHFKVYSEGQWGYSHVSVIRMGIFPQGKFSNLLLTLVALLCMFQSTVI